MGGAAIGQGILGAIGVGNEAGAAALTPDPRVRTKVTVDPVQRAIQTFLTQQLLGRYFQYHDQPFQTLADWREGGQRGFEAPTLFVEDAVALGLIPNVTAQQAAEILYGDDVASQMRRSRGRVSLSMDDIEKIKAAADPGNRQQFLQEGYPSTLDFFLGQRPPRDTFFSQGDKPPRGLQKEYKKELKDLGYKKGSQRENAISSAYADAQKKLGRAPTREEILNQLGVSSPQFGALPTVDPTLGGMGMNKYQTGEAKA